MSLGGLSHTQTRLVKRYNLPEFLDLRESPVDLVAHGADDIEDGDHVFFVDEGFAPDLRVDLVAALEVLADVVFSLGDLGEPLAPQNVEAGLSLAQQRSHFDFGEFLTHFFVKCFLISG